jgi:hypothetical protein
MIRKLKKEEAEKLMEEMNLQYDSQLKEEGLFLSKDEKRESRKIFLYTGDAIPNVPAEWTGQHYCTITGDKMIIPSIEGAQAIGKTAKKTIDLDYEQAKYVMSGRDVEVAEEKEGGYYILKTGRDVLGVGFVEGRKILNRTPKSRRTMQQYRTI